MTEADQTKFLLREVTVTESAACAGMTFGAAQLKQKTGALVVALRAGGEGGVFVPNPPDDRRLAPGDILIAIGSPAQLPASPRLLNPAAPPSRFSRAASKPPADRHLFSSAFPAEASHSRSASRRNSPISISSPRP